MAYEEARIKPRLLALLDCIEEKFQDIELCYLGPQAGAGVDLTPIGMDGSMAWVRVSTVSPVIVANPVPCYVRLGVDIEVGFATCYTINEDGSPRTAEEDLEIMDTVLNAQGLLLEAIQCCNWHDKLKDVQIVSWSPAGPDGGAVGGAWLVSVEIT